MAQKYPDLIMVRLSPDLKEAALKKAEDTESNVAIIVRQALRVFLADVLREQKQAASQSTQETTNVEPVSLHSAAA